MGATEERFCSLTSKALLQSLNIDPDPPNRCAAVGNLAVQEENQAKAGRIGVVEAVIDAMTQHPRHQGVQERGCSALRNICGSFDNQAKVAAGGGLQAVRTCDEAFWNIGVRFQHLTGRLCLSLQVTAALRGHLGHVGTCERGCAALGNLTFKNPDNQTLAAQCSSIEAVASAMRSHISASSVQERGAAALGAPWLCLLSGSAPNRKIVFDPFDRTP